MLNDVVDAASDGLRVLFIDFLEVLPAEFLFPSRHHLRSKANELLLNIGVFGLLDIISFYYLCRNVASPYLIQFSNEDVCSLYFVLEKSWEDAQIIIDCLFSVNQLVNEGELPK